MASLPLVGVKTCPRRWLIRAKEGLGKGRARAADSQNVESVGEREGGGRGGEREVGEGEEWEEVAVGSDGGSPS